MEALTPGRWKQVHHHAQAEGVTSPGLLACKSAHLSLPSTVLLLCCSAAAGGASSRVRLTPPGERLAHQSSPSLGFSRQLLPLRKAQMSRSVCGQASGSHSVGQDRCSLEDHRADGPSGSAVRLPVVLLGVSLRHHAPVTALG